MHINNIVGTPQLSTAGLASGVKVQGSIGCLIILWPAFKNALKY